MIMGRYIMKPFSTAYAERLESAGFAMDLVYGPILSDIELKV